MMSSTESQVLWTLEDWCCVSTVTAVLLYAERVRVSSRFVENVRERDRVAEGWRRSVQAIVDLERQEIYKARAR
jgi:hypothetical protein